MIIAIPFVDGSCNYDHLRDKLLAAGACEHHSLVVISRVQDSEPATAFHKRIQKLFSMSELVYLPDMDRSTSQLQNDMFREASVWANEKIDTDDEVPNAPWLYLDPNYVPQCSAWADLIETEYYKGHKQIMGMPEKYPDVVIDSYGRKETIDGGYYFDGPVVLDRQFHSRSGLIQSLGSRQHWRIHLRYEMSQNHDAVAFLGKSSKSFLKKSDRKAPKPSNSDKNHVPNGAVAEDLEPATP